MRPEYGEGERVERTACALLLGGLADSRAAVAIAWGPGNVLVSVLAPMALWRRRVSR